MSTPLKMFASLPSSYLPEVRRAAWGRMFGHCIQKTRENTGLSVEKAAVLAGMKSSEWMAIEEGQVPQEIDRLRAMTDAMEVSFDKIATLVLVCREAWEL